MASGVKLILTIVVVVLVWRYGQPFVAQRWKMHSCASKMQEDLDQVLWALEPKVESCTGDPGDATCIVSTLEPGGRRTSAPLMSWDCTQRHVPDGFREVAEKFTVNFGSGSLDETLTAAAQRTYEGAFNENVQKANEYLAPRLAIRRRVLEQPSP